MFRASAVILLAILAASPCIAGKNAGGALIVHTNNTYNWCNILVCTTQAGQPPSCEEANTEATREFSQVVWLLAAFPAESNPGVSVIYFGIDYDDSHLDPGVNYRLCGPAGSLEVPDDDWPYSGRGNSVAFGTPVAGNRLFRFYAFRIDGGQPGSYFRTTINPTGHYAAFVDDSDPPVMDECYRFGTVLWFQQGQNMCPAGYEGGACCFADGSCSVLSQTECEASGGTYQGDDTSCTPNPCDGALTACCLPGDICVQLDAADCVLQGGAPRGPAFPCDPNPCVPEACCWPGGGCSIVDWYECSQQGGAPAGPGSVCDPNPCTQPGACCFANGACEPLTEAVCAEHGGVFQGQGTPCDPNPCEAMIGACCFETGTCTPYEEDQCAGEGGSWLGAGIACDPNPCPQPGACCFPDGTCLLMQRDACEAAQGSPQEPGTPCDPNPCPPTATESTTWGRVRATYR